LKKIYRQYTIGQFFALLKYKREKKPINLPMTNFTPKKSLSKKTKNVVSKVVGMKPVLHASADALFFVQLFARACNTQALLGS
jgi:hypothetical protein